MAEASIELDALLGREPAADFSAEEAPPVDRRLGRPRPWKGMATAVALASLGLAAVALWRCLPSAAAPLHTTDGREVSLYSRLSQWVLATARQEAEMTQASLTFSPRGLARDQLLADPWLLDSFNTAVVLSILGWLPQEVAGQQSELTMVVSTSTNPFIVTTTLEVRQEDLDLLTPNVSSWREFRSVLTEMLATLPGMDELAVGGEIGVCNKTLQSAHRTFGDPECNFKVANSFAAKPRGWANATGAAMDKNKTRACHGAQRIRWHQQCMRRAWRRHTLLRSSRRWRQWQWLKCWKTMSTTTATTTSGTTSTTTPTTTTLSTTTTSSTSTTTSSSSTTATTTSRTTTTTTTLSTTTISSTSTATSSSSTTATTTTTTTQDPCAAQPCKNGGTCSKSPASGFACACSWGWGGPTCEDRHRVLEWDDDSEAQRVAEYKASAETTLIHWKDVCGGGSVPSNPGQSYSCSLSSYGVEDRPGKDGSADKFFFFSGSVDYVYPAGCNGMANTCAGPSLLTKPFEALPGETVKFSYKAQDGGDYYEVLIEVLACFRGDACTSADYFKNGVIAFSRGYRMPDFERLSYTFPTAGSYVLRFHLGSYDFTGGTALGAMMYVKPFLLESAKAGGAW